MMENFKQKFATPIGLVLVLALTFFLALSASALAAETIRSFSSNIELLADGSVNVTETIDIRSEGQQIRRGIFRDIPTIQLIENDEGEEIGRLRSRLDVLAVSRDGRAEPYALETLPGLEGAVRIRIGVSDIFLNNGNHRYTIKYTMTRIARQFEDRDELFWNATGIFWSFPIENAVATITLPDGAIIAEVAAFTGRSGSLESAVKINRTSDNSVWFRSTRQLDPLEGMSVAVSFPKGILTPPSDVEKAINALSDFRHLVIPAIAVFLVALYNFLAWSSVGRDPEKGTIIPLFYPPKGYSPALVHFIWAMEWKKGGWQAFTAAMISLAAKNLISIGKTGKKTKLTVTGNVADDLPPGEQVIFRYLRSRKSVTIDKNSGAEISGKRLEFIAAIEEENRRTYFKNNYLYVTVGVILSAGCILAMLISGTLDPIWMFFAIIAGVVIGLFSSVFSKWRTSSGLPRFMLLFWGGIFAFNLFGGALTNLREINISFAAFATMSIVLINVVFAVLMRAPTVQGRRVMDQIDGLRMYLETAEKERLNFVGEPDMSVVRFETLLPYAIALGVEKPWSEHFESELARNAVPETKGGYQPTWYHGSGFSSSNIAGDMASMASGMSAAMIAAQPASSSSSGFSSGGGGGGGSGGGGGGGGGGGW